MKEFLDNTEIRVEHVDNGITFDIIVTLYKGDSYAKVRIAHYHTTIVLVEKTGEILKQVEVAGEEEEGLTDRSPVSYTHLDVYKRQGKALYGGY